MIYRDFQGLKLSSLGFGAMRLPLKEDRDAAIDEEKTFEMVDFAIQNGINYFDTAYGYHGGQSEIVLGKALGRYPRESYYLATKFPGYSLENFPKVKEIFFEQLEKTGKDYFDFYLFHNVCEMNINEYLDPKYGVRDFLVEQKKNGRIRHLGFSCHGEYETLKRFLDAYHEDIEFCQLQINFLDWKFQNAKAKVELLKEYGIPVWVMEPLRGGKLAKLADPYEQRLKALRPDESIPAWAFRFLQTIPEVTVILSGMSDMEQLKANVLTFETDKPLNEEEWKAIGSVTDEMMTSKSVPCTACRYCVSECPMELNIPRLIRLYNEHLITTSGGGFGFIAPMALSKLPEDKQPGACLHCRSCEAVCPQRIKISEVMEDFVRIL